MGVQNTSFDVFDVVVIAEGELEELFGFAEISDFGSVVLVPLLGLQNCFGDLGSGHQVVFQNLSLPRSIFGLVLGHAGDQEGGHFLESVEFLENLGDLVDI